MNKKEFLNRLRSCLASLPREERDAAISYYEEFFEEAGEENEQSVINDLGSPEKVAQSILSSGEVYSERSADNPPAAKERSGSFHENDYNHSAPKSEKKDNTGAIVAIVILVITSPVWISAVGSVLAAIFGITVGLIAATAALIIVGLALFIAGIVKLFSSVAIGAAILFSGLIVAGIGTLLLIPTVLLLGKALPALIKWIVKTVKSLFGKKEAA